MGNVARTLGAAFAVVICVGGNIREAKACYPGSCIPGIPFPAQGSSVAANLPVVGYFGGWFTNLAQFELRTSNGDLVATTPAADLSISLLELSSPLVAGESYKLHYLDCGSSLPVDIEFAATAVVPFPTTLGSLSLLSNQVQKVAVVDDGM